MSGVLATRAETRLWSEIADQALHDPDLTGAEFGDWIAAQNASFEAHGIPGADLRPW